MKTITIENTKNIHHLEFCIPERSGVYLLVGSNGVGKTTLLVCLDRLANSNAFARGFSASRSFGEVDQYENAAIKYDIDNPELHLTYRKKSQRWAVSPKKGSQKLSCFGYPQSVFIRADSNRIDVPKDDIRRGRFEPANEQIKKDLNEIFETDRFSKLKRLRNSRGRGRQAAYFYVIEESRGKYYSEKRFSTGELAILRLVERMQNVQDNALVLLDEAEMALHPRIQKNLLDYMKDVTVRKHLMVFIATHSVTMIKTCDKYHIIAIEDEGNGDFRAINPCYPAKAIGEVDFAENIIFDAIFFVEDDMAELILKKMLKRYCQADKRFETITNCIVPVGGYKQTAELALKTKRYLFNRSKVFAVWDHDVFTDTMKTNPDINDLQHEHHDVIFDLGCTPEVWIIDKIEEMDHTITNLIRDAQSGKTERLFRFIGAPFRFSGTLVKETGSAYSFH